MTKDNKRLLRKLWLEFKWRSAKERSKHFIQSRTIFLTEVHRKLNFTTLLLISSITLVATATILIFLKFQEDINIPYLSLKNKEQLQYWAQAGDFFGGTLNPLLSFMALMAVLYTIRLQREELKEAREEAKTANQIQHKQTEIFERQNFEALLFRLLDVHARITETLSQGKSAAKETAFSSIIGFATYQIQQEEKEREFSPGEHLSSFAKYIYQVQYDTANIVRISEQVLSESRIYKLSHYFRNIYQILKAIDSYSPSLFERDETKFYAARRQYANMLRALLTNDELTVLAMNCLTQQGSGLKFYVEKYSLLKHLQHEYFFEGKEQAISVLFDKVAFMDGEEITPIIISRMKKTRRRHI